MKHDLSIIRNDDLDFGESLIGDCSCNRFYTDSHGWDESSRNSVVTAFERHVEDAA